MTDDKVYLDDSTFIRKDVLVGALMRVELPTGRMKNPEGKYKVGDTFKTIIGGVELPIVVKEVIGDELLLDVKGTTDGDKIRQGSKTRVVKKIVRTSTQDVGTGTITVEEKEVEVIVPAGDADKDEKK